MTIREIFSKADATVVNNFFCSVPIKELRDERALSICQGLQYFGKRGVATKPTTDSGDKLNKIQAQVAIKHFEALLTLVYEALGINNEDDKAEEKLNAYLDQVVEVREGNDVNDAAIRLMMKMKGLEHYRYKHIDHIRNTTDHETLRRWLQETESSIKAIVGDDPLDYYLSYVKESDIDKIDDYLGTRRMLLDRMFTYSDDEVKRFEHVNDLLVNLSKGMYHRTANLYRSTLSYGVDKDFDDDYEIEGILNTGVEYDKEEGDYDTVLRLENDDYYGSDFAYMLYVLRENDEKSHFNLNNIEECGIRHCETNTPDMTDKELECDWTFLNDGQSWIEWQQHPKFDNICVCHALHSMFDHHKYSLADIIRVNSFWVDCKIVAQRITDQRGRRYKEIRENDE